MPAAAGALSVVGTGIRPISQTPPEAVARIQHADALFYLVADPLAHYWLQQLNPRAQSLHDLYAVGKDRRLTYRQMVERVLGSVRSGYDVCLVSYGHPGVFAFPMHEALRVARSEGYRAEMIPGISAEDCLFADLGVDPGAAGCQSFEATDFLVRQRIFDPTSALILWQIGVIAEDSYKDEPELWNPAGLQVLLDCLISHYSEDHEAIVYEAAPYAWCTPRIDRKTLRTLLTAKITPLSTLYVPPKEPRPLDPDILDRLRQKAGA